PQDVQGEAWDYPDYFFARRVDRLERHAPTEPMLNEAVALIRRPQRPLIVCGGGVKYSQAEEALRRFAERCHLPIAETQAGKGALSSAH
ncbi:carbon monoxide dehydrogenase beta subunit family protein, partial [Salmonella enterica subsp. enterica serovar Infantis]